MRQIFLFVIITIFGATIHSQNVPNNNFSVKEDTIPKKILDYANFRIYYDYNYAPEAEFPEDKVDALTLLQVGEKYTRFMDYNWFRTDSICDANVRKGNDVMNYMAEMRNALNLREFKSNIVTDRKLKQHTIQQNIVLSEKYQYQENIPTIQWNLIQGDTIIAGYNCKRATCKLYGRNYIAWYTPEIRLPYGPYQFYGLPGLICKIIDTEDNFNFTLVGLEQIKFIDPIYIWSGKNIIMSNRNEVRKIFRNYCANPAKAIMNSGKRIKIPSDVLSTIEPLPYNPIDKE